MSLITENNVSSIPTLSPNSNLRTEQILSSVSKLLRKKIFIGCYIERKLIETGQLSTFKDVIVIDKSETDFIKILKMANDLLNKHFCGRIISCISVSDMNNDCFICTNLTGVAFRFHWFMIKNITLNKNIVNIEVKWLRAVDQYLKPHILSESNIDWERTIVDICVNTSKSIAHNVSQVITVESVTYFFRFLLVLFLTLLICSYRVLMLFLKGFHELNYFVQTITPILLSCIENITKAFGGILILIGMMWNSKKKCRKGSNTLSLWSRRRQLTYRENSQMASDSNFLNEPNISNKKVIYRN